MDVALSTIIIILFLVPGFTFRRFYFTEEFSKEFFKEKITGNILSTVLLSIFLHFIGYLLILKLCYHAVGNGELRVNIDLLVNLFYSDEKSAAAKAITLSIVKYCGRIFLYCFFLALLSYMLGSISKFIVRRSKLDRRMKLFRFQNEWHYFFSGEMLDFPRVTGSYEEVDFKYLDVLVDSNNGLIIYSGYLDDYVLSGDGGINRIYLSETKRRSLDSDKNPDYYHLPGKFFMIPGDEIKNIHITYYSVMIDHIYPKGISGVEDLPDDDWQLEIGFNEENDEN